VLLEDFSFQRKAHNRRSDALDVNIMASLQDLINKVPGRSMRLLARELGISVASVRNRMVQDISYKSYALRCGQFMNKATKKGRLAKAKLMLIKLKKHATNGQLIFFSEKNNFSQDQKFDGKKN
jgi:hypothetical protein